MTRSQEDPLAFTKKIRFNEQDIKRTKEVNHYIIINYQILPISRFHTVHKSLLLSYNMYYYIPECEKNLNRTIYSVLFAGQINLNRFISYFIIKRMDYKKRK